MHDMSQMLHAHNIRQTLERYCRGIDRLDAALIDSVYWEDAVDSHGVYAGSGLGFSAFIIPWLKERFTCTTHVLGQSNIVLSGDRAAADTYFMAYHVRSLDAGIAVDCASGRYADKFEHRGSEWKIKDRLVVMDWTETRSGLEHAGITMDRHKKGRRDSNDPTYAFYEWAMQSRQ